MNVQNLIEQIRSLSPEEQGQVLHAIAAGLHEGKNEPRSFQEPTDREYQEKLLSSRLIGSIKPRMRDQQSFDRFQPVQVIGKPVSETIIEERR